MIFKGLTLFSGKIKGDKREEKGLNAENLYVKASEDLKKSAEDLKKATNRLQESFHIRQEAMNKLVSIFSALSDKRSRAKVKPSKVQTSKSKDIKEQEVREGVAEAELFEVYREACVNFIETNKEYYFKLRNHSEFLSAMYKRYMGNLRYYDHEFRRLQDTETYSFSEIEAYVADQVIKAVHQTGREKFIREGHQVLYDQLCSKLLAKTAN